MHKFLIKDAAGFERDFGAPAAAAEFAKKVIGRDAVCAIKGNDVLWMAADQVEYFQAIAGGFEVVNSVASIRAAKSAQKDEAQAKSNAFFIAKAGETARRVSHVKFGLGTVTSEDEKVATVIFDGQKKPMRMAPAMLANA